MLLASVVRLVLRKSALKADDLQLYFDYLARSSGDLRIQLIYPEDYIELLKENLKLKDQIKDLRQTEYLYHSELQRALAAEDKLKFLQRFLKSQDIIIPHFKF